MRDDLAVLADWADRMQDAAARLGIEPGPVDWRLVEADRIYELAAVGMPGVMRHWTHGRDYWLERSRFAQGYGRLYELVVHADPPIAYLLEGNTLPAQKAVIAHVYGHADVFRHHGVFRDHPTDYPQRLAAQEARRAQYAEQYGLSAVDWVLDRAYSLQEQVAEEPERPAQTPPLREDPYADLFPRPLPKKPVRPPRYRLPTADVLGFLARESPVLSEWERDLVLSVRQEELALAPNRLVKTIHEGWAAYVQQRLGEDPDLPLADWEQAEQAVLWSHVVAPHPMDLNPYWFGWRLIRYLVARDGLAVTRALLMEETDASWIHAVLTPEVARALELYRYQWAQESVPGKGRVWTARRVAWPDDPAVFAAWRADLVERLTRPHPVVWVTDVNGSGHLVLTHQTPSRPLDPEWTRATLKAVRDLWGGPVALVDGDTVYTEEPVKGGR